MPDENVTQLLDQAAAGDASAANRLMPLVYERLRDMAGNVMGGRDGITLQPTALVNEAYIKLVKLLDETIRHLTASRQMLQRYAPQDRVRPPGALPASGSG